MPTTSENKMQLVGAMNKDDMATFMGMLAAGLIDVNDFDNGLPLLSYLFRHMSKHYNNKYSEYAQFIIENADELGVVVDFKGEDGKTLLMTAIQKGIDSGLALSLAKHFDVKKRNYGWQAAVEAIKFKYNDVLELLLNKGINVEYKDRSGANLLFYAKYYRNAQALEMIQKRLGIK